MGFAQYRHVASLSLAENLNQLLARIRQDLDAVGLAGPLPGSCQGMARALPLAHALPSAAFVEVTTDSRGLGWKLLSPAQLAHHGIKTLRSESAEVALGTQDFVFLHCGQVRYPETNVAFLFQTGIEAAHRTTVEASPFDSGALHRKVARPDAAEPARAFLARHSLPVPEYRGYLSWRLRLLFARPGDYVAPNGAPIRPDPIGLQPTPPATSTDPRLWTFEIRMRDKVDLTGPHLMAVFYAARLAGHRAVRAFLSAQNGAVHLEEFQPEDEGDFATLQRRCLDLLVARRIVSRGVA